MSPDEATLDEGDEGLIHAKLLGDGALGLASGEAFADGMDISLRQLRHAVAFPCGGQSQATLSRGVPAVLCPSAQEQVLGVGARRIIATMADGQPRWDRTVCQGPGEPVDLPEIALVAHDAIATVSMPLPLQAPRRNAEGSGPERFGSRSFHTRHSTTRFLTTVAT